MNINIEVKATIIEDNYSLSELSHLGLNKEEYEKHISEVLADELLKYISENKDKIKFGKSIADEISSCFRKMHRIEF